MYLIDQGMPYNYVMNIFIANYIKPIDDFESLNYFYKALSNQPTITGAYHDLGNTFAGRYDYDYAWKCYYILTTLHEPHPMAQDKLKYKEQIETEYPHYFK